MGTDSMNEHDESDEAIGEGNPNFSGNEGMFGAGARNKGRGGKGAGNKNSDGAGYGSKKGKGGAKSNQKGGRRGQPIDVEDMSSDGGGFGGQGRGQGNRGGQGYGNRSSDEDEMNGGNVNF